MHFKLWCACMTEPTSLYSVQYPVKEKCLRILTIFLIITKQYILISHMNVTVLIIRQIKSSICNFFPKIPLLVSHSTMLFSKCHVFFVIHVILSMLYMYHKAKDPGSSNKGMKFPVHKVY